MASTAKKAARDVTDAMVAALFDQHVRSIVAYLARLVGDQDLADDLALRTLFAAQRAGSELPGITNRRAWLYGIATDTALRVLTWRRRFAWMPARKRHEQRRAVEHAHQEWMRRDAVEPALLALPLLHRAPLLLYSHHRLNLTEVAEALHTSEDAAKSRLYVACALFREAFEGEVQQAGHSEIGEQLAVYDSLSREQQVELNEHLAACTECGAELAAFRRLDRALRNLPDPWPSERLKAELGASASRAQRRQTPESVVVPKQRPTPPKEPAPDPEPQAEGAADPSHAPRWQRLLLPAAMALLFVGSLWVGMRGHDTPEPNSIELTPTSAVTTDTLLGRVLPRSPTEAPQIIDATGHVTITFACDDVAPYTELARQFGSENLDVTVQLRSTEQVLSGRRGRFSSLGSRSSLDAPVALAAQTDAFCTANDPALLLDGLVRNLGPLARTDDSFAADQFYPEVLQHATIVGSLYLVPARFRPVLLRYDPTAFRAAGLEQPHPGWSWDDMLHSATALTQRDGATTRRWGFGDSGNLFLLARFFSATTSPLAAGSLGRDDPFANPKVRRLFEWVDDLYLNARAAPAPHALTEAGQTGISSDQAQSARDHAVMQIDVTPTSTPAGIRAAPFPVARAFDKTTPIGQVNGWAISSLAQHADAAWRWISYLSQNLPADSQGGLEAPARRSVPQMQAFWKGVPAADRDAYEYALEHLSAWPDLAQVPGMLPLYTELLSMISGETTLAALTARPAPPSALPPAASDAVTMTFAAPADQKAIYEQAAADFSVEHPEIRVRVVAIEDLMSSRQDTTALWSQMRVAAGRVDAMVGEQVPALVRSGRSQGILYDLTQLISETLRTSDYYPNTLEALQWQGRSYALPGRLGLQLVHYSQRMFTRMNVAYPQPGWTWSDFDRTVRAVALHDGGNSSWWGFKERSSNRLQLFKSRAGSLLNYTSLPPTPLLDTPAAVDAATWYAGLLKDSAIAPPDRAEEDSAMWLGLTDPSVLETLRSTGVDVAPFPVDPGLTATNPFELYDAFAISARTRHPDAAWQWLVYLQLHDPAGRGRTGIPARRDAGIRTEKPLSTEMLSVVEYALEHTQRPGPLRAEGYLVDLHVAAALQSIVLDGQTPATAMQQAQEAAQRDLGERVASFTDVNEAPAD